jgi:hypothetical protein
VKEEAALASGVNYETGKIVVVDPETGQIVKPCIPKAISRTGALSNTTIKQNQESSEIINGQECAIEILGTEENASVLSALEMSKNIIRGQILKDGKPVEARFVISITTLYEGSKCNGLYSGGAQYQNCNKGHGH